MRKIKFVFLIFIPLFWNSTAFANTNRVDDLAACAGIVIGNSAIDFLWETKSPLIALQT